MDPAGKVTRYHTGPDLMRHSRNFGDKMAAEAWLNAERLLIDRDLWTPPRDRERRARLAASARARPAAGAGHRTSTLS